MKKYSIRDVARLSNVSPGTVSRVLNHAANVDPVLQERIMSVVRQVGYQSGPRGRRAETASAVRHPMKNIAVLTPGMGSAWKNNALLGEYMAGIERAAKERLFQLSIYMADQNLPAMLESIKTSADGILIKMTDPLPDYLQGLLAEFPCVGFGAEQTADPLLQIVIDNIAGGMAATRKLLELGHERIAFLNHQSGNRMFIARSQGYQEAMKSRRIFRPEYLLEIPEDTAGNGAVVPLPEHNPPELTKTLKKLLELPERPTAVIVANDWGAMGLLHACQEQGVEVPQTFSVVGMDDVGNLCSLVRPELSSVAMPFEETGFFAACTLCDLIDGIGLHRRNVACVVRLAGEFRQRKSVNTGSSLDKGTVK
ncbi:MAG: LacI family DNA-binding transcriptional regulator [Victivallaceae bacterium]|nr:LacI family DNA-binding transcriptional regulator [Victivallaceae bacterium]